MHRHTEYIEFRFEYEKGRNEVIDARNQRRQVINKVENFTTGNKLFNYTRN